MALVLDYSAGFPGAAAIRDAGCDGAVRYIGFRGRRKCTNRDELNDFTRHGRGMALVYEDSASDWLGGFDRGRAAAARARADANAIGFPTSRPIYMAVDRDVVSAAEFNTMVAYLRGANEVLGVDRTGVYGEFDVCVRAAAEGVASWFWQCRAWSGSPVKLFAGRHLYQRVGTVQVGGVGCDINDVIKADWGQHNIAVEDDMQANEDVNDPRTGARIDSFENVTFWTNHFANRIPALEAKLDALAGALSDDEANIIAAVRAQAGGITPEQHAAILREQLPAAVLAALIELARNDTKETRS